MTSERKAVRALICGGRDYSDKTAVWGWLQAVHLKCGIEAVIEGGATGADALATSCAAAEGVPVERFPADWRAHGKSASPVRNQLMLDEGRPDIVIVFPGGRGTADMVRRAKTSGIPVRKFGSPTEDRHD